MLIDGEQNLIWYRTINSHRLQVKLHSLWKVRTRVTKSLFSFENDDIILTCNRKIEEEEEEDSEEGIVGEKEETSDGNSSGDLSFGKCILHGEDDDSCWSYASES